MATGVPTIDLGAQLFVRLTRVDGTSQQSVPFLAKSWESSSDGLTWTFHLHRGVKFSDGHPLTADDVIFSFAAIYGLKAAPLRNQLSTKGTPWIVSAPDPFTVTIRRGSPLRLCRCWPEGLGFCRGTCSSLAYRRHV